jgi:hypothetical protein
MKRMLLLSSALGLAWAGTAIAHDLTDRLVADCQSRGFDCFVGLQGISQIKVGAVMAGGTA